MTKPAREQFTITRLAAWAFRGEIKVDAATDCWNWGRSLTPDGYGRTTVASKKKLAHRAVYEAAHGPIPAGLQLDHKCRNRRCVNPDHLEPVTQRQNVLRGESPSARNARKTACTHGHPLTAENARVRPDGFRECRACDRERQRKLRANGVFGPVAAEVEAA